MKEAVQLAVIQKEVQMYQEQNTKEHKDIMRAIYEIKGDVKGWRKDSDERYAPKWIATLVYFLLAGGCLYIIQAILNTIMV